MRYRILLDTADWSPQQLQRWLAVWTDTTALPPNRSSPSFGAIEKVTVEKGGKMVWGGRWSVQLETTKDVFERLSQVMKATFTDPESGLLNYGYEYV